MRGQPSPSLAPAGFCRPRGGFTLIELMVVVSIMGMMLTMGIPLVYHTFHREAFRQTLYDMEEICSTARSRAIVQGQPTEVVFHPQARWVEVVSTRRPAEGEEEERHEKPDEAAEAPHMPGIGSRTSSAYIPESVAIEMLDINQLECKAAEIARVRFYPNGTCDELTLVLHSDDNRWMKLTTELTTGLTTVGALTE